MNARHYVGMHGLGDNIYQRAFVKKVMGAYQVYLETPWPQLYADLPIKLVKKVSPFRTQARNVNATPDDIWTGAQGGTRRVSYNCNLAASSIIAGMQESFATQLDPALFDLPPLPPPPLVADKPIAFVRPVTERAEWHNSARNPRPEYIAEICAWLRPRYHVVNVADVAEGAEWFVGDPPQADTNFIHGELAVMDMLSLLASSALVLGGVGWIVPAAIATRRPCFVVLGGQLGHNGPGKITDPRLDLSGIGYATPKDACPCTDMRHNCKKDIPDLMAQFLTWYGGQFPACNGSPISASAICQ